MKIDLEILEAFGMGEETAGLVNSRSCKEVLDFLRTRASRIELKSNLYIETKDADVQLDCIDIVSTCLNDFTQAFRDIMLFILEKVNQYNSNNTTLRYCISKYNTMFSPIDKEKGFINEIGLRNDIVHDYFNASIMQEKIKTFMVSHSNGGVLVVDKLIEYCTDNSLLEEQIRYHR